MYKISLRIQTHDLATRTETRVKRQHPLGTQRRSQQQLPQVFSKYRIASSSALFLLISRNSFSMEDFNSLSKESSTAFLTSAPAADPFFYKDPVQLIHRPLLVDVQIHDQIAFFFTAPDSQQPVRRTISQ